MMAQRMMKLMARVCRWDAAASLRLASWIKQNAHLMGNLADAIDAALDPRGSQLYEVRLGSFSGDTQRALDGFRAAMSDGGARDLVADIEESGEGCTSFETEVAARVFCAWAREVGFQEVSEPTLL